MDGFSWGTLSPNLASRAGGPECSGAEPACSSSSAGSKDRWADMDSARGRAQCSGMEGSAIVDAFPLSTSTSCRRWSSSSAVLQTTQLTKRAV
eukprot:13079538-Alexandrium_andersonii.AAC.1